MRAGLPHSLRERRRSRAERSRRATVGAPDTARAKRAAPSRAQSLATVDPAAQRVRDAGGPLDEACYACHCGFVFRAPVSTTVSCPHCRAPQAW
jgi:cytochrome c5